MENAVDKRRNYRIIRIEASKQDTSKGDQAMVASVLNWVRETIDRLLFPRPEVQGFPVEIETPQIEELEVSVQIGCTEEKDLLFQ